MLNLYMWSWKALYRQNMVSISFSSWCPYLFDVYNDVLIVLKKYSGLDNAIFSFFS